MKKHFMKGVMLGMFIGFVVSSPHRDEWMRKVQSKLNRFRRKLMESKDNRSL